MKILTKKYFAVIFFTFNFILGSCKDPQTNQIVIKKAAEIGGPILIKTAPILMNEAVALAADSIKNYQKSEIDPIEKKTLDDRLHDMKKILNN